MFKKLLFALTFVASLGLMFTSLANVNAETTEPEVETRVYQDYQDRIIQIQVTAKDNWTSASRSAFSSAYQNQTFADETAEMDWLDTNFPALLEFVHQGELETLVGQFDPLDEDLYTQSTWAAYESAVDAAEINWLTTMDADIVDWIDDIETAEGNLVEGAYENLGLMIDSVGDLVAAEYTEGSWATLQAELTTAQGVYDDETSTTQQLIDAKNNLEDEIDALVFENQAEVDGLEDHGLDETEFTSESWDVLEDALALPETTHAEIETKISAIEAAIANLEYLIEANLDDAKAAAQVILDETEIVYSEEQLELLNDALAMSEEADEDEGITRKQAIIAKTDAINAVVDAIMPQVDYDLMNAKEWALNFDGNEYSQASVEALWSPLYDAMNMPETDDTEKVAKTDAILLAMNALVFADQAELDELIEEAQGYVDSGDFTVDSAAGLQALIDAAHELHVSTDMNQDVIDAIDDITDYVAGNYAVEVEGDIENVGLEFLAQEEYELIMDQFQQEYYPTHWDRAQFSYDTFVEDTQDQDAPFEIPFATNADVEEFNTRMNRIMGLMTLDNIDELEAVMAEATNLEGSLYTEETWVASFALFNDAYAMEDFYYYEVAAKITEYERIINNVLVLKTDQEAYDQAVEAANEKLDTEFTWDVDLLEDLTVALAMDAETTSEITEATTAIQNATTALDYAALEAIITYNDNSFEIYFTAPVQYYDGTEYIDLVDMDLEDLGLSAAEFFQSMLDPNSGLYTALQDGIDGTNLVDIDKVEVAFTEATITVTILPGLLPEEALDSYTMDELRLSVELVDANLSEAIVFDEVKLVLYYDEVGTVNSLFLSKEAWALRRAGNIEDAINALPAIEDITLADKDDVVAARTIVDYEEFALNYIDDTTVYDNLILDLVDIEAKITALESIESLELQVYGDAEADPVVEGMDSTLYTTTSWNELEAAFALPEGTLAEVEYKVAMINAELNGGTVDGDAVEGLKILVTEDNTSISITPETGLAEGDTITISINTTADDVQANYYVRYDGGAWQLVNSTYYTTDLTIDYTLTDSATDFDIIVYVRNIDQIDNKISDRIFGLEIAEAPIT